MTPMLGIGVGLGFFLGIILHEYATALLADRLGDKTSRLMRRITLSPKRQVDPLGTLIVPAIFTVGAFFGNLYLPVFGWGKRHSLNPRGFRKPRRDIILVALTGPVVTAALAAIAGAVLRTATKPKTAELAAGFMVVTVFLTVIELIPLPGRDGGRILARFLSPSAAMKMEELAQYEALYLLGIFLLGRLTQGTLLGMGDPLCRAFSGISCGLASQL